MPPRLLLILAAVLFSTSGAAIKYTSLSGLQVACWRSIVAAATLWIALPGVRSRKWTRRLFGVGCIYALMLILFVSATKLTTSANSIFLQSTAPLYLLLIGPVFLHERLRKSDWMLMLAMAAGMGLFFAGTDRASATAPNPMLGNILAVASGLAWAIVIAELRRAARDGSDANAAIGTVFAGNLLAFALALIPSWPLPEPHIEDIVTLLYLGTCQIGLGCVLLSKAMRHVPAFEASVLILVEPALNPVWTWLLLGERPSGLSIVGGAILLSSTAINGWIRGRSTPARRSSPLHSQSASPGPSVPD